MGETRVELARLLRGTGGQARRVYRFQPLPHKWRQLKGLDLKLPQVDKAVPSGAALEHPAKTSQSGSPYFLPSPDAGTVSPRGSALLIPPSSRCARLLSEPQASIAQVDLNNQGKIPPKVMTKKLKLHDTLVVPCTASRSRKRLRGARGQAAI